MTAPTVGFDWGDGSAVDQVAVPSDPSQSPVATHTYTASGDYTITVTSGASSGSTTVTVTVSVEAEDEGGDEAPEEVFDPGEHTVAEVQAYVNAHPSQVQAVYDAEVGSRNRSTLVSWLEADES